MENRYEIRGAKTFQGMEGDGLNASLYRNGQKVAFILDEGCGGCMDFQWMDGHHNSAKEEALFKAFIDGLKATKSEEKGDLGFSDRDLFDGDIWVWDEVNKAREDRRMKRLCKTYAVYQVEGDKKAYPGGPQILTLKRDMAGAREYVAKKYPGKRVVFMNDEVNVFPPMSSKPKPPAPVKPPVFCNGAMVQEIPLDPTVTGEELENGADCSYCKGTGVVMTVSAGQKKEEFCILCKGAGRIPKRKATQPVCFYAQYPDVLAKVRAPLADPIIGKCVTAPPAECGGPVLWWKKNWFDADAQKRGYPKHMCFCKAHADYEAPRAGKTKVTLIRED